MARTFKDSPDGKRDRARGGRTRQRHISVRSVRRDPPDYRKLSRAVIALAMAEADAEAQAGTDDQTVGGPDIDQDDEEPSDGR
jgi:hypothetical protein